MTKKSILVWDLPTRVFHWLLAASFVGALATGDSERWRDIHIMLGHTMLILIAFRVIWGVIGSRYARFAAFAFGPGRVAAYLRSLLSAKPEHHVGHNPAGSWAIYLLLGLALREAANLEPLQPQGAPREIMPLIDNLNTLFARVARLIEHERRFTADAAHELRTPLAALMTQAQVARAAASDTERNHALDNVITGCARATRIVEQMLTLARLEPDDAAGQHAIFDLRALTQSVIADIAPSALQRGVDIELKECDETRISGNSGLIRIALRNLVDNAVRYSREGGRVQVEVLRPGGSVRVRITDQGPGLPAEERKKVGQRFYRVLGNAATGSGLGLSITRRIAELHDGALELKENSGGQGLTAELQLLQSTLSG